MIDRLIIKGLIKEGEGFKKYLRLSEEHCDTLTGDAYYSWVTKCAKILLTNYSTNPLTKKFVYASTNNTVENYVTMLKILKELEGEQPSCRFENVAEDIGC